ncbi:TetR family transcriptional regulator [Streptomyces xiaopingdaonensis]|uniref:TetR family transcriptional regulator n=1 Tax=Streptomyces xiaopingdaonensis TaxID=1565415 RepID=UPI0002D8257F|nr:TetR family transcriptional regulator [Streptomyces xiaopingdaonensis]
MTGLRERKKQRTRDALLLAAHQLFVDHGYDATTVDRIAERVEVSQRTFFRYFASKEEVAFHFHDVVEEVFVGSIVERPLDEAPYDVLRNALDAAWTATAEAVEDVLPLRLHLMMWRTVETTPSLLAAHLRRQSAMEDRVSAEMAARTGLDPDLDPRPRVLVAAFCGVMRAAGRRWSCGPDLSVEAARSFADSYVEHLAPALGRDWGVQPRVPSPATSADPPKEAMPRPAG